MNSNSSSDQAGPEGRRRLLTKARLTKAMWVAGLCGLLWLAAWFDPSRSAREKEEARARAESEQADAWVKELMPEAAKAAAGTRRIFFSDLGFDVPVEEAKNFSRTGYGRWLPEKIRELDGKRVRIEGYMLPTRLDEGKARECLILANQMACCYGQSPRFCEFIVGTVKGPPAPVLQDRPLVFEGKLTVADVFEKGVWMSLYALDIDVVGR